MTPQRRAILEALLESDSHPTADEIYALAKSRLPDLALATVYNTLRELTMAGELCELDLLSGGRHYDLRGESHAHRVCLRCGRVEDLPDDFLSFQTLIQSYHDNGDSFHFVRWAVTIYGYCAEHGY